MPTTPLFPFPEGLDITSVSEGTEEVIVRITSSRTTSCCPRCSILSSAIHSFYRRKPRDLPCAGRPIRLFLIVRKFFCHNPGCAQKVFTERLPDFIAVSSRLTLRMRNAVQEIGYASCGKGGEPLSTWKPILAMAKQSSAVTMRGRTWSYLISVVTSHLPRQTSS